MVLLACSVTGEGLAQGTTGSPEPSVAELLRAANAERARGDLAAGKSDVQRAISLQPADPAAWYQLGVIYGQTGDFRSAEASLRHALTLPPELARAHYLLGLSLVGDPRSKLDWPGAIAEFQAALRLQPVYPDALTHLAAGLTATGDAAGAIRALDRAAALTPASAAVFFNLGLALEAADKLPEAAAAYRKALSLQAAFPEASSALGKLLLRLNQPTQAEAQLRSALRANPDAQDAHYALGRALRQAGQSPEAQVEFEQALTLGRRAPDAAESTRLSNEALQLAAGGNLAGAEEALRKAVRLRPEYGVAHYNLGLILADTGQLDRAALQLEQAISLLPGQAKPWFDLGRVQRLQGKQDEALSSFGWAVRLDPGNERMRAQLRSFEAPAQRGTGATGAIRHGVLSGATADTAAAHASLAEALQAYGDLLGAAGQRLRALALQPDLVEARLGLAEAYERLQEPGLALLEYYKILLVKPGEAAAQAAANRLTKAQKASPPSTR